MAINLANGKRKMIIIGLVLTFALFLLPVDANAQGELFPPEVCPPNSTREVCQEVERQGTVDPVSGQGGVINKAANIIALIAGVAAVIVIIISGIMYATAGGAAVGQRAGDSPNRAKTAQSALTGAVIGLIVVVLAWAITRFIVDRVVQ